MEFESFEQALNICMTAEESSPEQVAAMIYCLKNAPPELRDKFRERLQPSHGHNCGCGCADEHEN